MPKRGDETVDVGESRYRARRSTVELIKQDILERLAKGPASANDLKYGIAGGSSEIRKARNELVAAGLVVRIPGRGGRDIFSLRHPGG